MARCSWSSARSATASASISAWPPPPPRRPFWLRCAGWRDRCRSWWRRASAAALQLARSFRWRLLSSATLSPTSDASRCSAASSRGIFSASCSARPPAACSATISAGAMFSFCSPACSRSLRWDCSTNLRIIRSRMPAPRRSGLVDNYRKVLRSPWARALIVFSFLEFGFMFGAFTYVGADLHLRFDVSFTLVGLFVGAFAVGGIMYSLFVGVLVNRLGPSGIAMTGGLLLALAYLTLAFAPTYWTAPAATTAIGLGFYMLHNTLQTNATQMTPEARGTAVAIFSAALYIGQTVGVTAGGAIVDHFTAVPLFVIAAIAMLLLGLWFARELKRRHSETQAPVG